MFSTMYRIAIAFFMIFGLGNVAAQIPSHVPTSNLIGYWPFNGNAQNQASGSHHGTVVNAVPTTDRFGQSGSAYELNGINAYLTLPSTVMAQVTGAYTAAIWLFLDTTFVHRGLGYELMADRDQSTWLYRFRIGYGYDNPPAHFRDSSYFDRIVAGNFQPRLAAPAPLVDGWTHFAFVYHPDNNGTMMAYVNGVLANRSTNVGSVSGSRQINVGRALWPGSGSVGGAYVKGKVDDIGIWNRALNELEVMQLATSCTVNFTSMPSAQSAPPGGTVQFGFTGQRFQQFQWQIDSTNTGNFYALFNNANVQGADSNVLVLSNVPATINGARFRCVFNDSICVAFTPPVRLTIGCGGSLTTNAPQSTSRLPNDSAVFSVGSARLNHVYQWQINTGTGWTMLSNFGQFSGVSTPRLVVYNLSLTNHGQRFRCLVNAFGCADTTAAATLEVLCLPRNLNGPFPQFLTVGQQALFSVDSFVGANYIWQRNVGFGYQNLSNGGNIQGANTRTLVINDVQWADNFSGYRCIVTQGHCGDTSGAAILQIVGGVSVRENEVPTWKMYPNPAKDEVMLERAGGPSASLLVVRNALGQLMLQAEVTEKSFNLNTTGWSEGIYLVEWEGRSQRLLLSR
jgi:hypothetical protein